MKDFTGFSVQERGFIFVAAVMDRRADEIQSYIAEGADVHYDDDLALRISAYLGHLDMVKLVVGYGADVHAQGESALLSAVRVHDEAMARFLMENGADMSVVLTRTDILTREDIYFAEEVRAHEISELAKKQVADLRANAKTARHLKLNL